MAQTSSTVYNRKITGSAANDLMTGGNGNDTLIGQKGVDTMLGGYGNDIYYVDNINEIITENSNAGIDSIISSVNFTLSSNVESLTLSGKAAIGYGNEIDNTLKGNTLRNYLYGEDGNDIVNGYAGADYLYGGKGNDTIYVDNAKDVVYEGTDEGIDTVVSSIKYSLGANLENLTLIGTGASGTGNDLNNYITGNTYANVLNGLAGIDTMVGGKGNDTYYIDNTSDRIVENLNEGTDSVVSSINYVLDSNLEKLFLTGSATNGTGNELSNYLYGNELNNILNGGLGNDLLDGKVGADKLIGGLGNDAYYIDNTQDVIIEGENEGTDTIISTISYTLSSNLENLTLIGSGIINAVGNNLNNILIGNTGNNIIDGDMGVDIMYGGKGNDIYCVDNIGDIAKESANQGTDIVYSSVSYSIGANIERLYLLESSDINATGNALANYLYGNNGNNTINGCGGKDKMCGGDGNDVYYVDNAGDSVIENLGEGTDLVMSSVSYIAGNNIENLTLFGTKSITGVGNGLDNYITGNAAVNTLKGNAGNDTLDGGAGTDKLTGGVGNDTYFVDNIKDVIVENSNEGIDNVIATSSYTLGANVENLILEGTTASNIRTLSNGVSVITYGESYLWKNYLDYAQGDNSQAYLGDCGLVSCQNVLIQSGLLSKKIGYTYKKGLIDTQETKVVATAISNQLCETTGSATSKGGTSSDDEVAFLAKYGVTAHSELATLDEIAEYIIDNKSVILFVSSATLWYGKSGYIDHAITLTGVAYNASDPDKIEGFYICDSGRKNKADAERYISYASLNSAFSHSIDNTCGFIIVTDESNKELLATLNGTGNELDNIITGSEGNNVLSGLAGNDTYVINQNGAVDTIIDSLGNADKLSFGTDILINDIVMFAEGNNLIINYDNGNQVTIQNQLGASGAIEKIQLANNSYLSNNMITSLVQQINSYAANNGMEITSADVVRDNAYLTNLIQTSWQTA